MKNLLVVEDDLNTLAGLVELLKDEGYRVEGAACGQKALEMVARHSFDLVICDYSLPDIDGLKVCHELRRRQPALVMFLVTGFYNTEIINAARENSINKVITKPIVLDDLLDSLVRYSKDPHTES